MKAAFLPDRGLVLVSGEDARSFLNGLLTTDMNLVQPGIGQFGALLAPQGKIITDFLVTETSSDLGSAFVFDCPLPLAQTFADRLGFYKLRAKVSVENISAQLGVMAVWDGEPAVKPDLAFADPRHEKLGCRIFLPDDLVVQTAAAIGAEVANGETYHAHRVACGVPYGSIDFMYGDAFPHKSNMDKLHGIDFTKGCYIGQEVVSRMEHRGTARTRIVRLRLGGPAPVTGTPVMADGKSVGVMGSSANGLGTCVIAHGSGCGCARCRSTAHCG